MPSLDNPHALKSHGRSIWQVFSWAGAPGHDVKVGQGYLSLAQMSLYERPSRSWCLGQSLVVWLSRCQFVKAPVGWSPCFHTTNLEILTQWAFAPRACTLLSRGVFVVCSITSLHKYLSSRILSSSPPPRTHGCFCSKLCEIHLKSPLLLPS